jgi:hypothetical protein
MGLAPVTTSTANRLGQVPLVSKFLVGRQIKSAESKIEDLGDKLATRLHKLHQGVEDIKKAARRTDSARLVNAAGALDDKLDDLCQDARRKAGRFPADEGEEEEASPSKRRAKEKPEPSREEKCAEVILKKALCRDTRGALKPEHKILIDKCSRDGKVTVPGLLRKKCSGQQNIEVGVDDWEKDMEVGQ